MQCQNTHFHIKMLPILIQNAVRLTLDDLQLAACWHIQQPERRAQVQSLLAELQLTLLRLQRWLQLAAGCLQDIC
jgi:hypothetical protein